MMGRLLLYIWMFTVSMVPHATQGQSDCPDEYVYTQQPPLDTVCNPYAQGILKLDCAVVGPGVSEIRWYFSKISMDVNSEDTILLTNSTKYILMSYNEDDISGIQLTVYDLNEDDDSGFFWCQGFVSDGSLSISAVLELHNLEYYPVRAPPCSRVVRNSVPTCASLVILTPEVSTTQIPTTSETSFPPTTTQSVSSYTPTFTSVVTTERFPISSSLPTTVSATQGTQQPEDKSNFFETSQFTLYIVLGLVSCLGIICLCLAVVIIVLCRKRCQGISIEGSENKEIGFDHLSNQSDLAVLSIHKRPSPPNSPYQPEISLSSTLSSRNTQNRDLSGDYAEIGPALVMNSDRLLHLHSYSEIRDAPPLPQSHPRITSFQSSAGPYGTSGYENPYDLPILPPEETRSGVDEVDSETRGYHVLERVMPTGQSSTDNQNRETEMSPGLISESSSFSTLPDSPLHNYHTLEHPDNQLGDGSHVLSSSAHDQQLLYDLTQHLPFQPQPYDSAQERRGSRLETIPEHPYHVLEGQSDRATTAGHNEATSAATESAGSSKCADGKAITSSNVEDDVCSTDDQEYDRLVDPPQLYHVLDHSPSLNRPRIHEFHFSEYNRLQGVGPPRQDNPIALLDFANPQKTDLSMLTDSLSTESSLNDSDMFDDPQYILSPVARRKSVMAKTPGLQKGESHSCTHGRPPVFLQEGFPGRVVRVEETVAHSKYCGDYERDPSYMRQLHSTSPQMTSLVSQLPESRDSTFSQDDSGFVTYCSQNHSRELRRQSSLPDISHVYQSLQPKTMDPPCSPYEKLKKQNSSPNETST